MNANTITACTKPACVQCKATIRALDKAGVPYDVVDISVDDAARDYVVVLGCQQVPVVVVGDEYWSGFRAERIKNLIEGVPA
ncbi:glutaredoxin domain-containing protein [Gordonia alkaliphila]|uniref:Redoxin NrdH n=1 Tax=Gordonia alkaliphila TaxID=1053547 RepID=A0ABP8Z4X0_9ACTN